MGRGGRGAFVLGGNSFEESEAMGVVRETRMVKVEVRGAMGGDLRGGSRELLSPSSNRHPSTKSQDKH